MKYLLLLSFSLLIICSSSNSQIIYRINESFESYDSLHLPPGWTKWNMRQFQIDPLFNWTVRDTGVNLPGVADPRRSVAHTGHKAIGVSWYSGYDTTSPGTYDTADAWLVTPRLGIISPNDYLSFWSCGGSPTLKDSMQIWVSTVDSLPAHFNHYIITLHYGPGAWGTFSQDYEYLDAFAGQYIWIGFRYYIDVSVDGIFVHIDDVQVIDPIGVKKIGTNIPAKFEIQQNYPNPFNPSTTINFAVPKNVLVQIKVYNILGQEVQTLLNEQKPAGYYTLNWDGTRFPSGTYFYRITAGDFVQTNKMVLVK
jgi:hypothetical protein